MMRSINCRRLCRFTPKYLSRLAPLLLGVADIKTRRRRYVASPEKALYLVCKRLAYLGRWYDYGVAVGRSAA